MVPSIGCSAARIGARRCRPPHDGAAGSLPLGFIRFRRVVSLAMLSRRPAQWYSGPVSPLVSCRMSFRRHTGALTRRSRAEHLPIRTFGPSLPPHGWPCHSARESARTVDDSLSLDWFGYDGRNLRRSSNGPRSPAVHEHNTITATERKLGSYRHRLPARPNAEVSSGSLRRRVANAPTIGPVRWRRPGIRARMSYRLSIVQSSRRRCRSWPRPSRDTRHRGRGPNVSVFVRARLIPITAAAVSLSRTATSDRPARLLRILRTTT